MINVPAFKMVVEEERYIVAGGTVHCFLTFKPFDHHSYFNRLMTTTIIALNHNPRVHSQYRIRENRKRMYPDTREVCSDHYIYNPTDYEYRGTAVLKTGDTPNVELAKEIAYNKAFRQALNFTQWCYGNMLDILTREYNQWDKQYADIARRADEMDNRVHESVYKTIE